MGFPRRACEFVGVSLGFFACIPFLLLSFPLLSFRRSIGVLMFLFASISFRPFLPYVLRITSPVRTARVPTGRKSRLPRWRASVRASHIVLPSGRPSSALHPRRCLSRPCIHSFIYSEYYFNYYFIILLSSRRNLFKISQSLSCLKSHFCPAMIDR